jgi:hypothetical protein
LEGISRGITEILISSILMEELRKTRKIFRMLGDPSWAGHVARMGEKRNAYRILVGNHWEDQDVGG